MTDNIPEYEQGVYEDLTGIRQYLSTLKKDRKNFIKSKDVSTTYNQVLKILNRLEKTREAQADAAAKAELPNRVDYLIDDIFQLLSLCFMTVGLTHTAPATYASLSTVQRLLEHLEESGVYTNLELKPIKERLDKFREIIEADKAEFEQKRQAQREVVDDELIGEVVKAESAELEVAKGDEFRILSIKLDKCYQQYQVLVDKISKISPDLQEILSQLVTIRRNLMNLITREDQDNSAELANLKAELKLVESADNFKAVVGSDLKSDEGGTLLNGLVDDCHTLISDLAVSKIESQVDPSLQNLYNELIKIKITLENLLVTRRWTLRETDLFNYQKVLQDIDNNRSKGLFTNAANETPQRGQAILLYILRRCYAIIYKLLESSEPISEALQPIHNQLSTVRRCLLDVKRMGGISSIRELYPYQLKLASIDNLRQDGKFMYDDQIPEGQGSLNALLAECFDIVHELKIEYYDNDNDETDDDNARKGGVETTKSSSGRSDNYDDDDGQGQGDGADDESELDRSLLIGEDDDEDRDAYDLPSYAASEINDSEAATDVEK